MSKDQPNSTSHGPRADAPSPTPPSSGKGADGGFLSSLADLEARINAIKSAHEQASARELELNARDIAITTREQELADRERAIAARLVKAEAETTRAQRELADAERARVESKETLAQATAMRQEGEQQKATLEQARATLDSERQRGEEERREHEFDVKRQQEELERERASVAEHARTLAEQMKRSDDEHNAAIWSNRIEAIQIQLGESNAARARLETELAQVREDVESLTQELIEANQNRGVPPTEIEKRDRAIADLNAKLNDVHAATTAMQKQAEQASAAVKAAEQRSQNELSQREQAIKAHEAKNAELDARAATLQQELEEATKLIAARDRAAAGAERNAREAAERVASVQGETEALRTELAAARELLEQADQAAKSSVPAAELAARQARIEELGREIETIKTAAAQGIEAARSAAAVEQQSLAERLRAAEHAATQATGEAAESLATQIRERDETNSKLRGELESARAELSQRVSASEVAERDQTIERLRAELEEAIEHATRPSPAPSGPDEASLREIAARDKAIAILKERLSEAMEAAKSRPVAGASSATDDHRRDRLRRYKALLQGQARKIVAAQGAIQRRHADCEMVLSHRSKLAQLAQQLAKAEKKITAGKARSGAAAAVLYFAASLGILAVMSWEVSKRVWPGTYIARAVIEADVGRRAPKPEDLEAWQKDHSAMLSDPRLMELAAQRMQQRGLAALGTPGELSARMKQDMYVQAGKPGTLTVELRGEGGEKTALVLDTLVTAFKSISDQARDERSNDLGVSIVQAATPGAEPLFDKRIEKAAEVFGGAALAAGLAGLVIWTRLVRAKKKFDQAAAVDAALGEVDWATLEASIKQNAAQKS